MLLKNLTHTVRLFITDVFLHYNWGKKNACLDTFRKNIMPQKILIIDDNKGVRESLEMLLQSEFDNVCSLSGPKTLISTLQQSKIDLILLDMNFVKGVNTGNEGLFWLKEIHRIDPSLIVIMITAFGDVELAVRAVKEGAFDFILKPFDNAKLLNTINAGLKLRKSELKSQCFDNEQEIKKYHLTAPPPEIIGKSVKMMQLMKLVEKVAPTDANVFVEGENGSGKGLIARQIHELSARKGSAFITVDLGAISDTLFESEFFGYVKGAFTDAITDKPGKIEAAAGGTLFLDEIGNLSLAMQAKLLHVLQTKSFSRLGSNKVLKVDFRLITATNLNLSEMVQNGGFREDLLYRINTISLSVPALREREGDVIMLAGFFREKYASKYNKAIYEINKNSMRLLRKYSWPGNVRELEHCIEKAVILSDSPNLNIEEPGHSAFISAKNDALESISLEEMEKRMIVRAIKDAGGNLSHVARILGITRPTLYNKLKKYDL